MVKVMIMYLLVRVAVRLSLNGEFFGNKRPDAAGLLLTVGLLTFPYVKEK